MNAECISEPCIINFANSARQESRGRFDWRKTWDGHNLRLTSEVQNSCCDGEIVVISITMSYDRVILSRVHVRMLLVAFVLPRQERPERVASVTIEGFLLGTQFGEGLADLGKVEKRVIAETV